MDQNGVITHNKQQFLELVACEHTTPRKLLPNDHDEKTHLLEQSFIEYTQSLEQQILFSPESRRTNDISALRNKLQAYADEIVDPYDHDQLDKCEMIITFLNQ